MKIIADWIHGKRSYTYGTILYKKFGSNEALKLLFDKGKTTYTEAKLLEELKLLCRVDPPAAAKSVINFGEMPVDSSDKILSALREEWMPFYTEMNYKRHELDKILYHKKEAFAIKRGKLAMEILSLEQKCMKIWYKRDFYKEFKKLPGEQEEVAPVVDPLMLVSRYKNVQGYIRKYKMLLKKDPTSEQNNLLLKQYTEEFEQLKKKYEGNKK